MAGKCGMEADCGDKSKVAIILETQARPQKIGPLGHLVKIKPMTADEINDKIEKRFGEKISKTTLMIALVDLQNEGFAISRNGELISHERGHRKVFMCKPA